MASNILSLVIDADIARSAGNSDHPVSSSSRGLLERTMKHRHKIAMCRVLRKEWKKHNSLFAKQWLSTMIARKLVKFIDNGETVKNFIESSTTESRIKQIALKDVHLVDLALGESKIITSNDDNARNAFCQFVSLYGQLKTIVWLNPVSDKEFIEEFLAHDSIVPKIYFLKDSEAVQQLSCSIFILKQPLSLMPYFYKAVATLIDLKRHKPCFRLT